MEQIYKCIVIKNLKYTIAYKCWFCSKMNRTSNTRIMSCLYHLSWCKTLFSSLHSSYVTIYLFTFWYKTFKELSELWQIQWNKWITQKHTWKIYSINNDYIYQNKSIHEVIALQTNNNEIRNAVNSNYQFICVLHSLRFIYVANDIFDLDIYIFYQ